jgi:hypothetical protein
MASKTRSPNMGRPTRAADDVRRAFAEPLSYGVDLLRGFLTHPRPAGEWPKTYTDDWTGGAEPPCSPEELDQLQRDLRWFLVAVTQWEHMSRSQRIEKARGYAIPASLAPGADLSLLNTDPLPWPNTTRCRISWTLDLDWSLGEDAVIRVSVPMQRLDRFLWFVLMESHREGLWARHLRPCRWEPCGNVFTGPARTQYCSPACKRLADRNRQTRFSGKRNAQARQGTQRAKKIQTQAKKRAEEQAKFEARVAACKRRYGAIPDRWPGPEKRWYFTEMYKRERERR